TDPGVAPGSEASISGSLLPLAIQPPVAPLAPPASAPAAAVSEASYDAHGVLVPVYSRTRRAPPYALVDEDGQVLKYVSPSPGLNLHRYLGKRVGVVGQRGYLPTLEARHVTAQRVIQLDRHQR
ncbi:MAG: hypothetical protein J5I93_00560, partial [Pirellulaceae bacterium]|nr:hypothetical protein [Pirellulaceae bacterium]